jgi:hypothetical protein
MNKTSVKLLNSAIAVARSFFATAIFHIRHFNRRRPSNKFIFLFLRTKVLPVICGIAVTIGVIYPAVLNNDALTSRTKAAGEGWYNSSWLYRKKITINESQITGSSNLTDFPVLISLSSDANLASNTQADADDILFTSSDGTTKLSHEIEKFTAGTGELIAWVEIPTLSYNANTEIYLYYGNSGATNQQDTAGGTWSAGYKGVYHLKESSGAVTDSSGNGNNSSSVALTQQGANIGKIDGANEFDGTDDMVHFGDPSDGDLDFGTGSFTVSTWAKFTQSGASRLVSKGLFAWDSGYALETSWSSNGGAGGGIAFGVGAANSEANSIFAYTNASYHNDSWRHVTAVVDQAQKRLYIYVDGAAVNVDKGANTCGTDNNTYIDFTSCTSFTASSTNPFVHGAHETWGQYYDGVLDEIRLSNTAKSADWIQAEYANQNAPATFSTLGSQETDTSTITITQSGYRLFANSDSTNVGAALANSNTSAVLSSNLFRLRLLLNTADGTLLQNALSFKLQYAAKGAGTCASPSGAYVDVSTNTPIAFHNNPTPNDAANLTTNASDPTNGSNTIVAQTYEESNPFTNAVASIPSGQDGKWDFALTTANASLNTTYCIRAVKDSGVVLNTYSFYPEVTSPAVPTVEWYSSSWTRRKKVTIQQTQIPGTTSLANFPVYIKVTNDTDIRDLAQTDGDDILFTSSNGTTKLDHEIDHYNSTNGTLHAWVKIPSLSATSDSVIYLYFGNTAAANQQSTATWSNNPVAMHLQQTPTGSSGDITNSFGSNHGTSHSMGSGDVITGQIANALDFSKSTSQRVVVPSSSSYNFSNANNISVSLWFRRDTTCATGNEVFMSRFGDGDSSKTWWFGCNDNNKLNVQLHPGSGSLVSLASLSTINNSTWMQGTWTYEGATNTVKLYLNGSLQTQQTANFSTDAFTAVTNPICIASYGPSCTNGYYGEVKLDDIRLTTQLKSAEWIEAEYNNQSNPSAFYTIDSVENNGWYNPSWQYRKKITINESQVSGSTALTNFPLLVNLTSDAALAANAQADGDDILFTSSDGTTKLSHEIEQYTSSTGELVAWVKIPSLSATANTDIYLYYGNASATSQQSASSAWRSAIPGVYHLNQVPTGSSNDILDSTSPADHGTSSGSMTSGDSVDAKIGKGLDFDGINDAINVPNTNNTFDFGSSDFTFETWVKTTESCTGNRVYISQRNSTNGLAMWLGCTDGNKANFSIRDGNNSTTVVTGTTTINTGGWFKIAATKTGTTNITMKLYVNGVQEGPSETKTVAALTSTSPIKIADYNANATFYPEAVLDEVRVVKEALSADWIQSEFNNQNSPSTFYTLAGQSSINNTEPNVATSLTQKKVGDDSQVSTGTWLNESQIKFTVNATDPDATDTLQLCIETRKLGTAFTNTDVSCGTGVAYRGTEVALSHTLTTQPDGAYHWQARIKDSSGAYSPWAQYGSNLETERDYGLDATAPVASAAVVVDGSNSGTLEYARDIFDRTTTDAWGSASTGGSWTLDGTAANFDTVDNYGQVSVAANTTRSAYLNSVSQEDADLTFRVKYDKLPAGSGAFQDAFGIARKTDTNTQYMCRLRITATAATLQVSKLVSNTSTLLGSEYLLIGLTPTVETFIVVRCQVMGTNPTVIKAKAWLESTTQPTEWQISVNDSESALQAAGAVGLRASVSSSNTNAPILFSFDDFNTLNLDQSNNGDGSLSQLSGTWTTFSSDNSGIVKYEYSIGTTIGATDVKTWTDNGLSTTVNASGLVLQTGQSYYFNIRAVDGAGNTSGVASSDGIAVNPTLTFNVSANSVSFSNLASGNNTETQTMGLTTSTNAYNGYVIKAYRTGPMSNGTATIPDFGAGSYSDPTSWGGSQCTGLTCGFGYTSSDTSINGTNKFGGGVLFAPFATSAPGEIVADHTSPVTGTPVSNETFNITAKVAIPSNQAAGTYTTSIVYTVVPQY